MYMFLHPVLKIVLLSQLHQEQRNVCRSKREYWLIYYIKPNL